MLDVDGQVISSGELIQRVEQLLAVIDTDGVPTAPGTATLPLPLDAPIKDMQAIHGQLHPPDLGAPRGLRSRVGAAIKRVVRKLTSWYVEPRWILQEEFDSQHIAFANLVADAALRIDAELDDVRLQHVRLKLQAVALGERLNRNVDETNDLVAIVSKHEDILGGVAMKDELRPVTHEVNVVVGRLGSIGASGADIDYAAFEDHFRGSSGDVEQAQTDISRSSRPHPSRARSSTSAADGARCWPSSNGRVTRSWASTRIAGMVEVCLSKGLPAVVDDGIHFLSQTARGLLEGHLLRAGRRAPDHARDGGADPAGAPNPARAGA